jgi:hypothetical protein
MRQKDLIFLLVSATFLAIVWIVFTIIHNSLTSTINGSLTQQIQSIDSTFDNQTIQTLQKRQKITPKTAFNGTDSFTPTPTITLPPVGLISPTGVNVTLTPVVVTLTPTPTIQTTP